MIDISGWFSYKGTTIMQHEDIVIKLYKLFEEIKPSQVLEIGTSHGGLTLLIRDTLDELSLSDTVFRTYDVFNGERYWLDLSISNGSKIELLIKNIFNHPYSDLLDTEVDDVTNFIQRDGRTIVMCDGGSKKNEFRILSHLLKPGDIIMAHDYSPNRKYFEDVVQEKIWNWIEIEDSDIEESVIKHNLAPYMENDFREVVWVCKIKK